MVKGDFEEFSKIENFLIFCAGFVFIFPVPRSEEQPVHHVNRQEELKIAAV